MFTLELPYDIDTFVKVHLDPVNTYKGTMQGYEYTRDELIAIVSFYKEAGGGYFELDKIEPMTDKEIEELKAEYATN